MSDQERHETANGRSGLFIHLKEDFARKQARNPKFSLRSYARQLQMSPAALSRIMNGKRGVSKRAADRILLRIRLEDPALASRLEKSRVTDSDRAEQFTELDVLKMDLLSEWYYFAVLSLAEIKGFKADPLWISKRLGITQTQAANALERLERLELLKRNSRGQLVPTCNQIATSDQVLNLSVRRLNFQSLELARAVLERTDSELLPKSGYSGITMAIDPSRIPEANRRITQFRRRLCAFLEGGEQREVYRLGVQLFPLSQEVKK